MQVVERPQLSLAELEAFDPNARQTGHEIRFLCPFCGEGKRPDLRHRSLSVNIESGLWVCQRCKASGKIREKWAPRERLSPRARARRAVVGLTTPHPARPVAAAADETPKTPTWRKRWDATVPVEGTPAADYLASRGISVEIADGGGVRYLEAWAHWDGGPGHWRHLGNDRRVIFPLVGISGEIVGIQGRAIDPHYLESKAKTLGEHGLFFATSPLELDKRPRVFITEAAIDALSLVAADLRSVHVLATQGTAWPTWLPRALAFGTALLGHDNDEPDAQGNRAGDVAAAKLMGELRAWGVDALRRRPSCKDWNELLVSRGPRQVRIEAEVEAWDRQLADNLMLYTLEQIARTTAEIPETDAVQELEDRVTATYHSRRMAALRAALEDYAAAATKGS